MTKTTELLSDYFPWLDGDDLDHIYDLLGELEDARDALLNLRRVVSEVGASGVGEDSRDERIERARDKAVLELGVFEEPLMNCDCVEGFKPSMRVVRGALTCLRDIVDDIIADETPGNLRKMYPVYDVAGD